MAPHVLLKGIPIVKPFFLVGAASLLAACQMTPMESPTYYAPPAAIEATPPAAPAPNPAPMSPPIAQPAPEPEISLPTSASDPCGASSLQGFVGSVAPQPFPAPGPVRVYADGDPITMDNNPNRVNVVVDRENRQRVVAISCG